MWSRRNPTPLQRDLGPTRDPERRVETAVGPWEVKHGRVVSRQGRGEPFLRVCASLVGRGGSTQECRPSSYKGSDINYLFLKTKVPPPGILSRYVGWTRRAFRVTLIYEGPLCVSLLRR